MRRHFKGAKFQEPQPPRRGVGRIQLVDGELRPVGVAGQIREQMTQQAVGEPRRRGAVLSMLAQELLESDLELVEPVIACLVDSRRLAGRTDKGTRKQIRQRRVVLPVGDQALQQIGPPQQRTVGGCGTAERDVIASAGACVATVEHEFLGAEP